MRGLTSLRRSASALAAGDQIVDYLTSADGRAKLIKAAKQGGIPATAVSEPLLRLLGAKMENLLHRQFAGRVIRAVLAEEGYEVAESGVRVPKDKVFSTASTYKEVEPATDHALDPVLKAVIGALTEAQADAFIKGIFVRFPSLRRSVANASQKQLTNERRR